MELYVVRHGQTDWNDKGIICGRTDVPLNRVGEMQAKRLAERLEKEGAKIDLIIASPLLRARQTAEAVADRLNIPLETDGRLIEQNFGVYEGAADDTVEFQINRHHFAIRYPDGESMMQMAHRIYGFLDALKARKDKRSVMLVSHGSACRILNTYFEDINNEAFYQWKMENTECRRYTLADAGETPDAPYPSV